MTDIEDITKQFLRSFGDDFLLGIRCPDSGACATLAKEYVLFHTLPVSFLGAQKLLFH